MQNTNYQLPITNHTNHTKMEITMAGDCDEMSWGNYCDIEMHTPPRVFITRHQHGFRVVQAPELQTRQRATAPVLPLHRAVEPHPTAWRLWLNKYARAFNVCAWKSQHKYVGEKSIERADWTKTALAVGVLIMVVLLWITTIMSIRLRWIFHNSLV